MHNRKTCVPLLTFSRYSSNCRDPPFQVPCNKIKKCKNGGKTIIDLRNGPGSDPYRCRCPRKFKGDLCEICEFKFVAIE